MPATLGMYIDEFGQTAVRAQPVTKVTPASSSPPSTGGTQTTAQPTSANTSRSLQLHDPGAAVHPGTPAKPVAETGGYWWHDSAAPNPQTNTGTIKPKQASQVNLKQASENNIAKTVNELFASSALFGIRPPGRRKPIPVAPTAGSIASRETSSPGATAPHSSLARPRVNSTSPTAERQSEISTSLSKTGRTPPEKPPSKVMKPGRAATPKTAYYTFKRDVPLGPGQSLGFASGKGYYAVSPAMKEIPRARAVPLSNKPRVSKPKELVPLKSLPAPTEGPQIVRSPQGVSPATQPPGSWTQESTVSGESPELTFPFEGLTLEGGGPYFPVLVPEIVALRARIVGQVVGYRNGKTGVFISFYPLDTSAIPDGFEVEFSFYAIIAKAGGSGTRTVRLLAGVAPNGIPDLGTANAEANAPQIVDLARGEHVMALMARISVIADGSPLFTWGYAEAAELTVYPHN